MATKIPVGRDGLHALVDDTDVPLVAQFRWRVKRDHAGKVYARRGWFDGRRHHEQFMHNLLMGSIGVDHRDHDGLNNQRANLRLASAAQNGANQRARPGRFKGVRRRGDGWQAYIRTGQRQITVGTFPTAETAAGAYDAAARELFGDFAHLNHQSPGGQ